MGSKYHSLVNNGKITEWLDRIQSLELTKSRLESRIQELEEKQRKTLNFLHRLHGLVSIYEPKNDLHFNQRTIMTEVEQFIGFNAPPQPKED